MQFNAGSSDTPIPRFAILRGPFWNGVRGQLVGHANVRAAVDLVNCNLWRTADPFSTEPAQPPLRITETRDQESGSAAVGVTFSNLLILRSLEPPCRMNNSVHV